MKLCIRLDFERMGRVCFVMKGRMTAFEGKDTPMGSRNSSTSSRFAAASIVSPLSTFPPANFHSPAYRIVTSLSGVERSQLTTSDCPTSTCQPQTNSRAST
eukprot:Lithocolla_globosa_v1_NODE_8556_length_807_cov_3.227394.p2 type:complete len:101 gc:universal NODE_8556_length_807_cov_3.227394:252-554(+)